MLVSPVTKGLLARARRGGALLPPSKDHNKVRFNLICGSLLPGHLSLSNNCCSGRLIVRETYVLCLTVLYLQFPDMLAQGKGLFP